MIAISINNAKQDIEKYVRTTIDNHEETIITTDEGAVVMVNQDYWNEIQESLNLLRDKRALSAVVKNWEAKQAAQKKKSKKVEKSEPTPELVENT